MLKSLINYDDRLARVEKKTEKLEQRQEEATIKLMKIVMELERIAEREKWREEKYQHAIELERAKSALEHAELEKERLRLELERERERRQLPPADEESGQT
jgi:phosphorylcholine metabolism protein LicD